MQNRRSRIALMNAKAFVDGELVAEADLSAAIVDRAPENGKKRDTQPAQTGAASS
jgi:hypothetical protein